MVPLAVLARVMTDPDRGSSGGTIVLVAAAIVLIAGLCLFLMFRRGSIADRSRADVPDPEVASPPAEAPDDLKPGSDGA